MDELKGDIKCPYCENVVNIKMFGECPFCNNRIFVYEGKAHTWEEVEFQARTEELLKNLEIFEKQYHFPKYLLDKSISIEDKIELVKNDLDSRLVISEVIYYESLSSFYRISLFVKEKILDKIDTYIKNIFLFVAFFINILFIGWISDSNLNLKFYSIDLDFFFWIWWVMFPSVLGAFVGDTIANYKEQEEFRNESHVNYLEYIQYKNINPEILLQFLIEKILDHRIEWKKENKNEIILLLKDAFRLMLKFLAYVSFIFIFYRYFSFIFLSSTVIELWRKLIFSSSLLIMAIGSFNFGMNPPKGNNEEKNNSIETLQL